MKLFDIVEDDVFKTLGDLEANIDSAAGWVDDVRTQLVKIGDLKGATLEDCMVVYPAIQQLIPELSKAFGRSYRLAGQLNNIRARLDLEEGDSPPCEC